MNEKKVLGVKVKVLNSLPECLENIKYRVALKDCKIVIEKVNVIRRDENISAIRYENGATAWVSNDQLFYTPLLAVKQARKWNRMQIQKFARISKSNSDFINSFKALNTKVKGD